MTEWGRPSGCTRHHGGGVFDRSSGARAYRDMFLFEVSQLAAERGSLGLGALLESAEATADEKVTDG